MTLLVGILAFLAIAASIYHFESLINPGVGTRYSKMDPLEKFIFDLDPEWDLIANFGVGVLGLVLTGVAYTVTPVLGLVPPVGLGAYSVLRAKVHGLWPF